MMAWQAGGVKITHNAAQQFNETSHIDVASAQPGDLIFVGPYNPSAGEPHHVAIEVGPGLICEAYDTGYPIRTAQISEYAGKGLNAVAGSFPGGGVYTGTATAETAAYTAQNVGVGSFLGIGGLDTFTSAITNLSLWKRAGMFALGAILILFTVRWLIKSE